MTDISADNASRIADGLYSHNAVDYPNTLEEFAAEGHHVIYALRAHIDALEASSKALVEAGKAMIEVVSDISEEAYGYDNTYETTFHGKVHEALSEALIDYRAATKESKHD